jgi:CRP-like cAMP-binding protein
MGTLGERPAMPEAGQALAFESQQQNPRGVDPVALLGSLRQCRYFQQLADMELIGIAKLCREVSFSRGETVMASGSRRQAAYLITQGEVGVFFKGAGDAVPVNRMGPGTLAGAFALVTPSTATGFAIKALTDISALHINGRDFQVLCESNPRLGYDIARELVSGLNRRMYELYYSLSKK